MNVSKENYVKVNDTELCWFEWGEKVSGQETIFLIHATGFHARCWDQTIRYLGDKHIIAIDMRGHGRSKNKGPYTWEQFGADATAFISTLDLNHLVGVGHSMGGHSLTQAMAGEPNRFERAILVDPVIMDPEFYVLSESQHENFLNEGGSHPVARRRNQFADPQAMFDGMDKNSDGKIGKDEAPERLSSRFGAIDANSDDFIDKAEWQKYMQKMMQRSRGGGGGGGPP